MRNTREWYLWSLVGAAILQSAGSIAYAFHAADGTNHLAFLTSFSLITIAPVLLAIAAHAAFARLADAVMLQQAARGSQFWIIANFNSSAFVITQTLLLPLMGLGIIAISKLLSTSPVCNAEDAMGRLAQHDLGVQFLLVAYFLQLVTISVFATVTLIFTIQSYSRELEDPAVQGKESRSLLWAINIVNALLYVCDLIFLRVHHSQKRTLFTCLTGI